MADTDTALRLALRALDPVGRKLVVIGGTAQRLFPRHPLGRDPGFERLTTEDVDLAAPLELADLETSSNLLLQLTSNGFEEKVSGGMRPKVRYTHAGSEAYVEFLAPRRGGGVDRSGTPQKEMRFGGLVAEVLPRIDILLHQPWSLRLEDDESAIEVQVANPIAYVVQKLLVLPNRQSEPKRAKDVLYIHDTLAVFAGNLDALGSRACELVPALSPKARKILRKQAETVLFVEGNVVREAAEIALRSRAGPETPASIAAALRRGLPRVLKALGALGS